MDAYTHLREAAARLRDLLFVSGKLCLDFADTVEPRDGPQPVGVFTAPTTAGLRDFLPGYADLTAWAMRAGALTENVALRLLGEADRRPSDAGATMARAIALREAIYRAFWLVAHGDPPAASDLAVLKREYLEAIAHAELVGTEDGFAWAWADKDDALDRALWPVARSATELLTEGELRRVKVCPGDGGILPCAWLFYDASKNRNRRWCTMDDCGKISKARRQTDRRRSARGARGDGG